MSVIHLVRLECQVLEEQEEDGYEEEEKRERLKASRPFIPVFQ